MSVKLGWLVLTLGLCASLTAAGTGDDEGAGKPEPTAEATHASAPAGPDAGATKVDKQPVVFERLRVTGAPDRRKTIPGSVSYIDKEQLDRQSHTDIHRVLSQVPGVIFTEEEGYGLRPNIGMRGTGTERSSKITVMEDGVLIAPAPYSAPSAYYFPTVARMEAIEIRKGSSAIQQGPFTNGGVINLLSSSIPSDFGGSINVSAGGDALRRGGVRIGGATERFGWLAEAYDQETDGFKKLDNGANTGHHLQDYMVKLRFNSGAAVRRFQALELKLGRTGQQSDETYLGLTQSDFDRTPNRRYAASAEDVFDSDHDQVQLRYFLRVNKRFDLTATVYRNDFFRNWRKLQSVQGSGLAEVLDDPASNPTQIAILRGDIDSAADELAVRNNRRDYYASGLQVIGGFHPGGGHTVEVVVRYHEDEEDRFQEEDLFAMISGRMERTTFGTPGSQSNRISSAQALAFSAQDTIVRGNWTLTPGVRYEMIDFRRDNFGGSDPDRTGVNLARTTSSVDVFIPGFGVSYDLGAGSRLFGGVHRGFAPPGPGADDRADPEESVNYEVGYRLSRSLFDVEAVVFFNDYDNLLGADTLSSGGSGSGDTFNGGEVVAYGFETVLGYDPGRARGWAVGLPLSLSYTFTEAEFRTSFASGFGGWGDEVTAGDELPYLPNHQGSIGAGFVHRRASAFVNVGYLAESRTRPGQGPIPVDESTDARWLVDLSGNVYLPHNLRIFAHVRNLTDESYVVARRPAGLRPGLPRTASIGLGWDF